MRKILIGLISMLILSNCNNDKRELERLIEEYGEELPLPSTNDKINILMLKGGHEWGQNNHRKADSLFSEVLKIDSTFYLAMFNKAFSTDPIDIEMLKKAKNYSHSDTSIHKVIFDGDYAYWVENNANKALEKFKIALDKYPENAGINYLVGMAYLWKGDGDNSLKHFNKSLSLKPDQPNVQEMLGWSFFMKKDYKDCIDNFEIAIENGAKDPNIFRLIGFSYKELNDSINSKLYIQMADSLDNK